jgi:hypothetical protein
LVNYGSKAHFKISAQQYLPKQELAMPAFVLIIIPGGSKN